MSYMHSLKVLQGDARFTRSRGREGNRLRYGREDKKKRRFRTKEEECAPDPKNTKALHLPVARLSVRACSIASSSTRSSSSSRRISSSVIPSSTKCAYYRVLVSHHVLHHVKGTIEITHLLRNRCCAPRSGSSSKLRRPRRRCSCSSTGVVTTLAFICRHTSSLRFFASVDAFTPSSSRTLPYRPYRGPSTSYTRLVSIRRVRSLDLSRVSSLGRSRPGRALICRR